MKTTIQALFTALVVAAVLFTGASTVTSCNTKKDDPAPTSTTTSTVTYPGTNTYSSVTMGDQGASAGSYWNSASNSVISSGNFSANVSSIDLTFVTVPTSNPTTPTLASPDQRASLGLTVNTTSSVATFIGTSSLSYASLTDSTISKITAPSTKSVAITANGTYAIVTQAGKKGVLQVTGITTATGSLSQTTYTVTFNARIQK